MAHVLLIGIKPETVDISDPDLPPDITQEKIAAGIEETLDDMRKRVGNPALSILPDSTAEAPIAQSLAEHWDRIVIGGGIRMPASELRLFERILNAVHRPPLSRISHSKALRSNPVSGLSSHRRRLRGAHA